MFAIIKNGAIERLVQEGTAFDYDGIQYPANWCNLASPPEKAAMGMVDVVYDPRPSDKYYWVSENPPQVTQDTVSVSYTATPKDLESLKASETSSVNTTANTLLSPSDWRVVKAMETGGVLSASWSTWRQAVRDQANASIALIEACTTVEELEALPAIQWPNDPSYVEPSPEQGGI